MKSLLRLAARAALFSIVAINFAYGQSATVSSGSLKLRIGYQKSSTLITILKAQGSLEKALAPFGVSVTWNEFASGLPLTEALNADAVDFSADVADTVPVFAQAAHARFVYVAQEAPSPGAQAIIVKRAGPLQTLADLRGRRIAVTKAAGSHYLLLAALAKAGLAPSDVHVSYLTPADGRAAFERGSVDAWITWDPYVASVDQSTDVRILANANGLASYQRYYLASSSFAAANPEVIGIVYQQLSSAGTWVRAHPDAAAKLLAPIWGLDGATIERANARRSYAVRAVEPKNFGEQQKIADTFYRAGLLPAPVDTGAALLWNFATKRAEPVSRSTAVSSGSQ